MSSFWDRSLPPIPTMFGAIAFMFTAVLVSRWWAVRSLERRRQRASEGARLPDRVWSGSDGGPWIVTICGVVYEVWAGDLPKGRELERGLLSDRDFRVLAASRMTHDDIIHRNQRFERGDLVAAKLVHNRHDADKMPWRIDALDRERAYRLFGFEDERQARDVLGLFEREVIPPADGTATGAADVAEIDAARARDEAEDVAP